jgi:hypothetical protein
MKKIILVAALLMSGFAIENVAAQFRVGFDINIGNQPVWGPVGYDHVESYYMPDIDAYYNVPKRQYIYMEHGRWTFASALPYRYHYDLYSGYKVVINDPQPYRHGEIYRERYAEYKGNHNQQIIRNSHEPKYFEIKDHPEHEKWKRDHDHQDNGKGHNDNKGRGRNDHN